MQCVKSAKVGKLKTCNSIKKKFHYHKIHNELRFLMSTRDTNFWADICIQTNILVYYGQGDSCIENVFQKLPEKSFHEEKLSTYSTVVQANGTDHTNNIFLYTKFFIFFR